MLKSLELAVSLTANRGRLYWLQNKLESVDVYENNSLLNVYSQSASSLLE